MSQSSAILKLPLASKEPKPTDLRRVLELVDRLMDREQRESGERELPDNVIPFPAGR